MFDAVYQAHVAPAVVAGAVGALHCAADADADAVMLCRPLAQVMRLGRSLLLVRHGLRLTETILFVSLTFVHFLKT